MSDILPAISTSTTDNAAAAAESKFLPEIISKDQIMKTGESEHDALLATVSTDTDSTENPPVPLEVKTVNDTETLRGVGVISTTSDETVAAILASTISIPEDQTKTVTESRMTSDEIEALVSLGHSIAIDGRYPIFTNCPYCKADIKTRTEKSVNYMAEYSIHDRHMCIGSLLVVAVVFTCVMTTISSRNVYWLFIGIPLGIVLALGILLCVQICANSMGTFADVTHYCPICEVTLGTSSGQDEFNRHDRLRGL